MATSRRVGNYATSANAVIRNSDAIFDAAMSGKPDFTKISKEAIKGRSLERRAVTKAEADVASAGLKAFTNTNLTRMREDTKKEIADIKRPAKRMAGIVGGLGAIAGGYVMMEGNKKDKAERDELRSYRDELDAKQDARDIEWEARNKKIMDQLNSMGNGGTSSADSGVTNTGTVPSPKNVSTPSVTRSSKTSSPVTSSSAWQRLSNVIRYGEGTTGQAGYNTQFTGTKFNDMSRHPRQLRSGGGYTSDAAGAYQFLSTTWDGARKALDLKDFSPESQEKAGRYLTQQRGVNPDQVFNNIDEFRGAMDKLAPEWASLPYSGVSPTGHGKGSSYYGQGGKDLNTLWQVYNQT